MSEIETIKKYLFQCQDDLCQMLETEDEQTKFFEESWQYQHGRGGGRSRVLSEGKTLERAGVNVSHIAGDSLPPAATKKRPELTGFAFEATGLSSVIHPANPYAPTAHLNVRYFVASQGKKRIGWFGGGFDLTPYYGFDEDCQHWHQVAKSACDFLSPDTYSTFKKAADDYFYLPNRDEQRGIGGIFYDDLCEPDFDTCFAFMQKVGHGFINAYQPILQRRKNTPFTERERQFQLYRRGRYVEFNLVYDRGTLFGLQSKGRTEAILMSLPPLVSWRYNYQPEANTPEAKLYEYYLKPKNWL